MKVLVQVLKKTLLLVFTCLTAGITEEIIFRGYLLPILKK
jgi:membrane protease YdiL (CAAX protease family)